MTEIADMDEIILKIVSDENFSKTIVLDYAKIQNENIFGVTSGVIDGAAVERLKRSTKFINSQRLFKRIIHSMRIPIAYGEKKIQIGGEIFYQKGNGEIIAFFAVKQPAFNENIDAFESEFSPENLSGKYSVIKDNEISVLSQISQLATLDTEIDKQKIEGLFDKSCSCKSIKDVEEFNKSEFSLEKGKLLFTEKKLSSIKSVLSPKLLKQDSYLCRVVSDFNNLFTVEVSDDIGSRVQVNISHMINDDSYEFLMRCSKFLAKPIKVALSQSVWAQINIADGKKIQISVVSIEATISDDEFSDWIKLKSSASPSQIQLL